MVGILLGFSITICIFLFIVCLSLAKMADYYKTKYEIYEHMADAHGRAMNELLEENNHLKTALQQRDQYDYNRTLRSKE